MKQLTRYAKCAFIASILSVSSGCALLPRQFDEAKENPDLACATYRPDSTRVPSVARDEIISDICESSRKCAGTSVESIEYLNAGASTNSIGWLMCPAIATLSSGQKVRGAVNLYVPPYESSLKFSWTSDRNSIQSLRTPEEIKKNQATSTCTASATAFSFAATFRDTGISPQETLTRMKAPAFRRGFPDGALKEIINMVYFDPDLSRWPASRIYSAVAHDCLLPQKQFTPLQ